MIRAAHHWTWFVRVLLVGSSSILVSAGPIGVGTWYEFGFDPNHSPLAAGCQPADPVGVACPAGVDSTFLDASPWTFSTTSPVELTITDALLPGDFFDVYNSGTLVGSTPSVPLTGVSCGLDPSVCVVDPGISHAEFLLTNGTYSLTIDVHAAQILGEGFFRLDPVPEPGTFGLLAVAMVLLYGVGRLHRRAFCRRFVRASSNESGFHA